MSFNSSAILSGIGKGLESFGTIGMQYIASSRLQADRMAAEQQRMVKLQEMQNQNTLDVVKAQKEANIETKKFEWSDLGGKQQVQALVDNATANVESSHAQTESARASVFNSYAAMMKAQNEAALVPAEKKKLEAMAIAWAAKPDIADKAMQTKLTVEQMSGLMTENRELYKRLTPSSGLPLTDDDRTTIMSQISKNNAILKLAATKGEMSPGDKQVFDLESKVRRQDLADKFKSTPGIMDKLTDPRTRDRIRLSAIQKEGYSPEEVDYALQSVFTDFAKDKKSTYSPYKPSTSLINK